MRRWLLLLFLSALTAPAAAAAPGSDIMVSVRKEGPEMLIDVDCPVQAPLSVIWDVLTDYDHMSAFISTVEYSAVEGHRGNLLVVRQKGKTNVGLFTFSFEGVREVEIIDRVEIRSHYISGDLESSAFTTRVIDVGGVPHIINIGRYVPRQWIPPLVGPAVIGGETRRQFEDIRKEILRRSATRSATGTRAGR